jgi:hypothetical protein
MAGKCPGCKKIVSSVSIDHVRMSAGLASQSPYHGVAYLCPFCDVILGVGVDPTRLQVRLVGVKKPARKRPRPRAH